MTDKPISLAKARKARARDDKRKTADANAVKFGQTKVQKQIAKTQADRKAKLWSDHKRDPKA